MRYHIDKADVRPTWIDKSIVICSTESLRKWKLQMNPAANEPHALGYMQVGRDKTTKGVLFSESV